MECTLTLQLGLGNGLRFCDTAMLRRLRGLSKSEGSVYIGSLGSSKGPPGAGLGRSRSSLFIVGKTLVVPKPRRQTSTKNLQMSLWKNARSSGRCKGHVSSCKPKDAKAVRLKPKVLRKLPTWKGKFQVPRKNL